MTSTRIPSLPTNLKERIAALEQKAGNGGAHSRPLSPTGNVAPNTSTSTSSTSTSNIPSAGNFRDKIAKFERKGGVPVPRGRFGLGAPPTSQGPQRQGELYGNRIPAPARTVSIGMYPSTRPTSPTGDPSLSSASAAPDRRSFSLSNILSDFDDQPDCTPVTSPTLTLPPDSPESTISMNSSPQTSPSLSTNSDPVNGKRSIVRGTSFQKALEIARNAEVAKLEGFDPLGSMARQRSLGEREDGEDLEVTPIIVVSSDDVVHVDVEGSVMIEQTVVPVAGIEDVDTLELVDEPSTSPQLLVGEENVEVEGKLHDEQLVGDIVPEAVEAKVLETPAPNVPVVDEATEVTPTNTNTIPTPTVVESETTKMETKEIRPVVVPVVIEIAPLTVRKRRPTLPDPDPDPSSHEPMPSENLPLRSGIPLAKESRPAVEVPIIVSPPSTVDVEESSTDVPAASTNTTTTTESRKDVESVGQVSEANVQVPPKVIVENEQLPSIPTPPQIVLNKDQPMETKYDDFNSRKAALSLNADLMNSESFVSPPLQTGMSDISLSDVIGNYFTAGLATGDKLPNTTFSPPSASPMSPPAKLAYDVQDTPPPARPRQKELDLLSPPPTGVLSASSSVGSSFSAISSLGSRPMSMIETSPGHINRALRMTPATSRGVPVFVPPNSSLPRKSDFVYFPPTPDPEETEFGFGSVTLHKSSHSLSEAGPVPATTFTAVVHDKVKESVASASASVMLSSDRDRRYVVPETPQPKRSKHQTYLEPLSPGQGELTALLREAVWLEDTLNKGELPADVANGKDERDLERARLDSIEEEASATATAKEEERRRIAYATEQLKLKRDEPTSGRLKHTFLIPLTKARSAHRKEASAPPAPAPATKSDTQQSKMPVEILHPKSASVTDKSGMRAMPKVPQTAGSGSSQVQRPATPEKLEPSNTGDTTTKSPKSSRFNGFRRLGGVSRAHTVNGASVRYSNSTSSEISSEDSQAVVTPPQNNLEFGIRNVVGELGESSNHSTASFPSLSPKKSANNLGRAASFAEKMWSRARTKSSGSTLSVSSEMTIDEAPRLPPLGPPPALSIPSLQPLPLVVPPSPEMKPTKVIQPPKRSTSLKRTAGLPPIPTEPVPSLPKTSTPTPNYLSQTPIDTSEFLTDSLLPPTPSYSSRPSSMTSFSSAGSLPSPLFDKELFDAFPSVPGTTPMPDLSHFIHRRDNSTPSAVNHNPSFDSTLLSSAIHLASSYKSGSTPAATMAVSNNNSQGSILPSRGGTPTPMSRRSGEAAR